MAFLMPHMLPPQVYDNDDDDDGDGKASVAPLGRMKRSVPGDGMVAATKPSRPVRGGGDGDDKPSRPQVRLYLSTRPFSVRLLLPFIARSII